MPRSRAIRAPQIAVCSGNCRPGGAGTDSENSMTDPSPGIHSALGEAQRATFGGVPAEPAHGRAFVAERVAVRMSRTRVSASAKSAPSELIRTRHTIHVAIGGSLRPDALVRSSAEAGEQATLR
jgi:hypothetical protein